LGGHHEAYGDDVVDRAVGGRQARTDIAGVAGTYNRSTYASEKRIALDRWAEHLMAIVEGRAATVVPLKRGVS
jgi:hypothetical protein